VGVGLGEQRFGLGLERLDGVGASGETGRRLLEFDDLHEGIGELGGVSTLLPIHYEMSLSNPPCPTPLFNWETADRSRR